jgi:phosphoglucomutase
MSHIRNQLSTLRGRVFGTFTVATADEFTYVDPVDGSISRNQGLRILFTDGSRVVFRLSGTAGSGATIRVYFEKYEGSPNKLELSVAQALDELVKIGLSISNIPALTGFNSPTVIT